MKKYIFFVAVIMMGLPQLANAWGSYNFVSADELKSWLDMAKPILMVDIQEKNDFAAHHIVGSFETNAYPVKSDKDRQTIDPAMKLYKNGKYEAVVVICPRGKGGAKRAYEYLEKNGVTEAKLFILTGGMENWPHKEWVEAR